MQYNPPFGSSDPNAPYVNGNPGIGVEGSIPPAEMMEFSQREIVNAVAAAGMTPANTDTNQLLRAIRGGQLFTFTDTGAVNALAIAPSVAHTAIVKGVPFRVFPSFTNTAATTLRVNTLTPVPLLRREGGALQARDIVAGVPFDCVGDGLGNVRLLGVALQQARTLLTANLQLYVDPRTGSDSNDGLSWGTAFATAQRAWNVTANNYDLNGFQVFVNLSKGTPGSPVIHTAPLTAYAPPLGSSHGAGAVIFIGDTTTPGNVLWGTTGANAVLGQGGAQFYLAGMKFQTSGAQTFAIAAAPGSLIGFQSVEFGQCGGGHMNCNGGFLQAAGAYTISGSAPYHGVSSLGGNLILDSAPVTLTGTPNFSGAFVSFVAGGNIEAVGTTFSGSATGQRYLGGLPPGSCNTNGGGANFFPGSSAGSAPTGSYN